MRRLNGSLVRHARLVATEARRPGWIALQPPRVEPQFKPSNEIIIEFMDIIESDSISAFAQLVSARVMHEMSLLSNVVGERQCKLVLTTQDGLWRGRLGDAVEISGFDPQMAFPTSDSSRAPSKRPRSFTRQCDHVIPNLQGQRKRAEGSRVVCGSDDQSCRLDHNDTDASLSRLDSLSSSPTTKVCMISYVPILSLIKHISHWRSAPQCPTRILHSHRNVCSTS
ncbi:hypothetical protein OG21DRAFT_636523 [Imleria badia]|nr:hypothetical protein OG21DRAFT_636523 [Imleria badia]